MFHVMGIDYEEKHWFTYAVIWSVNRITDEVLKVS
jgi:hypothetical protein